MASSSASPSPSSGPTPAPAATSEPSPDVLASIITQVSPTGQPARAPPRRKPATKPTAAKPARSPSTSQPATSSVPSSASPTSPPPTTSPSAPVTSEKALPASPPPAPSSKPAAPAPARPASPRKRKRKTNWLDGVFAFLTCSSPARQAGNFDDSATSTRELGSGKSASTLAAPGTAKSASRNKPETSVPMKELSPNAAVAATAPLAGGTPAIVDAEALSSQEAMANTSREGATLPRDETGDVLSGAVVPPGKEAPGQTTPGRKSRRRSGRASTGTGAGDLTAATATTDQEGEGSEAEDEEEEEEFATEEDDEDRLIMQGGVGIPIDENGDPRPLLTELGGIDLGRKCLVLDLDETLVHSSFKMIHSADFVVPVEIENQSHNVYVIKRPGVDQFLQKMGEIYEVVVFTASLSKYADPVLDHLDIHRVVRHRLFRESCYNHKGNYVKDLSQLGRPIGDTIIIDNSPASYIFHPKNAVPVSSWFNDPHDTELTDLLGVLTDLAYVPDVRGVLDNYLDTETDLRSQPSMGDIDELTGSTGPSTALPAPVPTA